MWLVTLPGNLLIDVLVVFIALLALKRQDRGRLMERLWWRVWLRGFAADAIGVGWLLLVLAIVAAPWTFFIPVW